jgi:hypothetical protein
MTDISYATTTNTSTITITFNKNLKIHNYTNQESINFKGVYINSSDGSTWTDTNITNATVSSNTATLYLNYKLPSSINFFYASNGDAYGKPVLKDSTNLIPIRPIYNYVVNEYVPSTNTDNFVFGVTNGMTFFITGLGLILIVLAGTTIIGLYKAKEANKTIDFDKLMKYTIVIITVGFILIIGLAVVTQIASNI